jgi:hypothetical protein
MTRSPDANAVLYATLSLQKVYKEYERDMSHGGLFHKAANMMLRMRDMQAMPL